jgi:glycosyltransferase involved in cell wall biosynthesis
MAVQHSPDELPWVSLVTPAYNQGEYLAETIESVLAQDYPRLEYIVLDDGSTDDTSAVLARYEGRLRHGRHDNMGQARTLNRGWGMARGTLFGYLSSDDRLEPRAISSLVQALQAHPDAAAAYCDFTLIDARGRPFRQVHTEDFDLNRLCIDLVCQPGPGALFRRDVFDRAGGWTEHLRQVPDFEFWLRAARFGQFIRVHESLAQYRVHEGSATFQRVTPQRSMEIVQVMRSYWKDQTGSAVDRSMAGAHLIAAKSHAQSGRFTESLVEWNAARRHRASKALAPAAWRMLLAGMLRRAAYSLRRRHQR